MGVSFYYHTVYFLISVCYHSDMKMNTTPIRIDNDLYNELKRLAQEDDRSVTVYTNRILRDKVIDKAIDDARITAYDTPTYDSTPIIPVINDLFADNKKSDGATPPISEIISEPAATAVVEDAELACCKNPTKPCKHWVWDTSTGEVYRNILSGRYMEVE